MKVLKIYNFKNAKNPSRALIFDVYYFLSRHIKEKKIPTYSHVPVSSRAIPDFHASFPTTVSRKRSFPEAIPPDSEALIIGDKRKFSPKKSKNDEIIKIDLEEDDIKEIPKGSDQVISLNLTLEIPETTKTEILEDEILEINAEEDSKEVDENSELKIEGVETLETPEIFSIESGDQSGVLNFESKAMVFGFNLRLREVFIEFKEKNKSSFYSKYDSFDEFSDDLNTENFELLDIFLDQ